MTRSSKQTWRRWLIWVVAAAAGLLFIWWIRRAMVTLLLAIIMAYILKPAVDWLSRIRLPLSGKTISRFTSTLIVYLVLIAAIWGLVQVLIPPLAAEAKNLKDVWSLYQAHLPDLFGRVKQFYQETLPPSVQRVLDAEISRVSVLITKQIEEAVTATLHGIWTVVELFLVPILAFYFLSALPSIKEETLFFVPDKYRPGVSRALSDIGEIFGKFIEGQLILCVVAGVVVTFGLYVCRMNFYLTLGLIAGLTRAIPILGPIVGGIPIVTLALFRSFTFGLWVLAAFAGLHFFESKYLMPKVLGFQLGIHPVLIIVGLLIGWELFGIIGMFLAVPAVAIAKLLVGYQRSAQTTEKDEATPK